MEVEDFVEYAKYYICETRGLLFLDPIWDRYTQEDILTEYFTIRVREDEEFKQEMENSFITLSKKDEDFFNKMTAAYEAQKVKEEETPPENLPDRIEDDFNG